MIRLYIVDRTAQSRSELAREIENFTRSGSPDIQLLPSIEVIPCSPSELKHREKSDLVILGPELAASDISFLSEIANELSGTPSIIVLSAELRNLPFIERLARIGIRDFITAETTPQEFLEKLICLARSERKKERGEVILALAAKGGVGVTTAVAALGEALSSSGKKVCLIDLDFENQCLTRFLRVTPFINESLSLLLSGSHAMTSEIISQCVYRVWPNEDRLSLMSPPAALDNLMTRGAPAARPFMSVIEELAGKYDAVIIDAAKARGGLLSVLLREASAVHYFYNREPATIYATISTARSTLSYASPECKVSFIEIESLRPGIERKAAEKEILESCGDARTVLSKVIIPFSKTASAWPGSGGSAYSLGGARLKSALDLISNRQLSASLPKERKQEAVPLMATIKALFPGLKPERYLAENDFSRGLKQEEFSRSAEGSPYLLAQGGGAVKKQKLIGAPSISEGTQELMRLGERGDKPLAH